MIKVVERQRHKVLNNSFLTPNTFILRLERNDLMFRPGQHIGIAIPGCEDRRDYTIYSGIEVPYIELLIREFKGGALSPSLHALVPGDEVEVWGPRGDFLSCAKPSVGDEANPIFVCTGTGIAPFHSAYASYRSLNGNCHIIHGIRTVEEQYDKSHYGTDYFACVSTGEEGDYLGRVTDYLQTGVGVVVEKVFFLCGNSNMIRDTFKVLTSRSVPSNHIYTEVYF